jgi:hypothetical protein
MEEYISALNDKSESGQRKRIAREIISSLNVKGCVEIAPEEEAEKYAASGAINDAPGAKHASGGGMAIGGQSSGVGASSGPTEPTSASTTTAEQVFVGSSSLVANQTVAAAKGSDAGVGSTVGEDDMKSQELGSPQQQHEGVVGVASEDESAGYAAANGAIYDVPDNEHSIGGGVKSGGKRCGLSRRAEARLEKS